MLEYLHIRNLALIEDVALEFSDGINALTGETGAGKSFILKALGFVLGDRLTADIVRPGAEKAQVEALFTLADKEYVLKRELSAGSGRSRFYINDSLSSQDALRDLRSKLISHTSQHAQQQLLQPAFQTLLLEKDFAKPELLAKRDELLSKIKSIANEIENLKLKQSDLADRRELLEMQSAEIDKVSPAQGEEEELEEARKQIRNQESERKNYSRAMALLHGEDGPGLIQMLTDFGRLLQQMAKDDPDLQEDYENVDAFRQTLSHMGNQFRRPPAKTAAMDIDAIEERLFAFAQLKRKLKRTMPQIFDLKADIEKNLSFLDVCALDISHLSKQKSALENELKDLVTEITPIRKECANEFVARLEAELKDLGFSEHARVVPEFVPQEIWPGIKDEKGRILWAPNPGQNPQPLDKIASGGELSRFLLGLNILGANDPDLAYIFDEIDTGIGGLTLNKVSEKLHAFSNQHQVILITHWPQLAAKARKHFQIRKIIKDDNTFTQCEMLDKEGRKAELARMAGGGSKGKALAENLLKE